MKKDPENTAELNAESMKLSNPPSTPTPRVPGQATEPKAKAVRHPKVSDTILVALPLDDGSGQRERAAIVTNAWPDSPDLVNATVFLDEGNDHGVDVRRDKTGSPIVMSAHRADDGKIPKGERYSWRFAP